MGAMIRAPHPPLLQGAMAGMAGDSVVSKSESAAAAPIPSGRLSARLKEIFRLSPEQASSALWVRGAGGDGRAELLAARGDRILELVLVEGVLRCNRAAVEHDATQTAQRYASNYALAAAARSIGVHEYLLDHGQWRACGQEPSDHVLGTVIEALVAASWDVFAMNGAEAAVSHLKEVIDSVERDRASVIGAGVAREARQSPPLSTDAAPPSETLVRLAIAGRLPIPVFVVEEVRVADSVRYVARVLVRQRSATGVALAGGLGDSAPPLLAVLPCSSPHCATQSEAVDAAAKTVLDHFRSL